MKFDVGDKIFAKVRGYPMWPGKIFEKSDGNKYIVTFYPNGECSVLSDKRIYPLQAYVAEYGKAKKSKKLSLAIDSLGKDLSKSELLNLMPLDKEKIFKKYYSSLNLPAKRTTNRRNPSNKMVFNLPKPTGKKTKRMNPNNKIVYNQQKYPERVSQIIYGLLITILKSLHPSNPLNVRACLNSLQAFKELDLTGDMLVHYPFVAHTILGATRYLAIPEPSCTPEEAVLLRRNSRHVRMKAQEVFAYFQHLRPGLNEREICMLCLHDVKIIQESLKKYAV